MKYFLIGFSQSFEQTSPVPFGEFRQRHFPDQSSPLSPDVMPSFFVITLAYLTTHYSFLLSFKAQNLTCSTNLFQCRLLVPTGLTSTLNLLSTCLMICSILGSRPISFPSPFPLSHPLPQTDYLVNETTCFS